jgi:hypothetical protein
VIKKKAEGSKLEQKDPNLVFADGTGIKEDGTTI